MKLTDFDKELLMKVANVIECDWFEFALDDYGEDCVFDNEDNKKYKLAKGIQEMLAYNNDVVWILFYLKGNVLKKDGDKIKVFNTIDNVFLKNSRAGDKFFEKYNSLEQINALFTNDEVKQMNLIRKEIDKDLYCETADLLPMTIKLVQYIEQQEKKPYLATKANEQLKLPSWRICVIKQFEAEV